MVGRRGFLKTLGAALVTAVAAPAFIPAERLEFGVPKLILPPEPALNSEPFHLSNYVLDEPSYVEHRQALLDAMEALPPVCAADDTARLQAMLDRGGHIDLSGQTFYVSEPLCITRDGTYLENAHVIYTRAVPALVSIEGRNQRLVNSHFIGHPDGVGHAGVGIRVLTGTIEPRRPVRVEHGQRGVGYEYADDYGESVYARAAGRVVPLWSDDEARPLPADWVARLLWERG